MLVGTCPGGMISGLEIAQAMLHRPAVLFLAEPTVGLDPVARHAVWQHIRDVRRSEGTTIVMTTHYMEEAEELCDEVAIMHRRVITAAGSPETLREMVGGRATLEARLIQFTGSQ